MASECQNDSIVENQQSSSSEEESTTILCIFPKNSAKHALEKKSSMLNLVGRGKLVYFLNVGETGS